MSRKVTVVLEDDLDGTDADETVYFSLDGVSYEIDLSADNASALREAFSAYIENARKSPNQSKTRARKTPDSDTAAIRAWAREQGLPVNERGRVPADIRAQYEAAHV